MLSVNLNNVMNNEIHERINIIREKVTQAHVASFAPYNDNSGASMLQYLLSIQNAIEHSQSIDSIWPSADNQSISDLFPELKPMLDDLQLLKEAAKAIEDLQQDLYGLSKELAEKLRNVDVTPYLSIE